MTLRLSAEEPGAGPWRTELLASVAEAMLRLGQERGAGDRTVVLAVDGRSSGGKTTLAARLAGAVPGSAVVHTDDIAWFHSRFGWADLLIDGILAPVRAGQPVAFRPPAWQERRRPGAIEVPAGCPLLIVEGVGAARRESAHLTDVVIWVQADEPETERRNLARVGGPDGLPTVADHRDWMAEEEPFLAGQRPWERADLVVCGTPELFYDPGTEVVVAPPPSGPRVVRASPGLVWRAFGGDQAVGAVRAFLRPDNRWFVAFDDGRADSDAPLLAAVAADAGADLYATADERDQASLDRLARLGFTVNRRESRYVIPTGSGAAGSGAAEPEGIVIISAADADEDELRWLDDTLRQDVPGTAGWRWDPGDFREETFDSAQFDPATYLVAVDADSGRYVGLARVWNQPGRPRLGLIGVTRPYRRRGLARVLLAQVFAVLHRRGQAEVTAEADDTNTASRSLLLGLGARRVGGDVELVWRANLPTPFTPLSVIRLSVYPRRSILGMPERRELTPKCNGMVIVKYFICAILGLIDRNLACVIADGQPSLSALSRAGFDTARPAFVNWLGVTMYLDQAAIEATVSVLGGFERGTEVVLDYLLAAELRDTAGQTHADLVGQRDMIRPRPGTGRTCCARPSCSVSRTR